MDSVTVVMSVFKRHYTFKQQLEAVINQSHKNTDHIVWVNKPENIEIPQDIINYPHSIYSEKKFGVWERFKIASKLNTKYICIIDDDTIPGTRWVENCINTIKTNPGVITTRGGLAEYGKDHRYPSPDSYKAFGWCNQNEKTVQVDMGCHCWFFETNLLKTFWEKAPSEIPMNYGEDMHLSYVAQLAGSATYVAPHPVEDKNLWGSMPETGSLYGSDKNAISWSNVANSGMNTYWNYLRSQGFKIIAEG